MTPCLWGVRLSVYLSVSVCLSAAVLIGRSVPSVNQVPECQSWHARARNLCAATGK
jgi:hypothetical protein